MEQVIKDTYRSCRTSYSGRAAVLSTEFDGDEEDIFLEKAVIGLSYNSSITTIRAAGMGLKATVDAKMIGDLRQVRKANIQYSTMYGTHAFIHIGFKMEALAVDMQ